MSDIEKWRPDLEERLLDIARNELQTAARYAGFGKIVDQIASFREDPVWSHFGFDNEEFLRLRYIGNYYTSIFRKMGDMYERFVKSVVVHALGLDPADVDYAFDIVVNGETQRRSLDVAIDVEKISHPETRERVYEVFQAIAGTDEAPRVAVIEVRSCYQIGDSKRIQADETAALAARATGLVPILMVFCSTSLVSPLKRLRKTWHLTEGMESYDLLRAITRFDLYSFLKENRAFLKHEAKKMMDVLDVDPGID